ncbi:MAG: hypothetical protein EOP37_27640 [Rubrivivax sp.]|nr:MAG: hypothetical protein EOP37_27640 [Rubrivivax sp.]
MASGFTPKVGQVLLCDFGQFAPAGLSCQGPSDFDRRIPPEMVKKRLVIVLNGRLSRQSCIVVPLSSSHDPFKMGAGVNVEIPVSAICPLNYFKPCVRWAKADCVHTVSKLRLAMPRDAKGTVDWVIDLALTRRIQRAAVRALNAGSMLIPVDERALLIDAEKTA